MPVYICLLRGINVSGKRMKMDDVRAMFELLDIPNAQTLLASGNVVFQAGEKERDSFVEIIEAAIQSSGLPALPIPSRTACIDSKPGIVTVIREIERRRADSKKNASAIPMSSVNAVAPTTLTNAAIAATKLATA